MAAAGRHDRNQTRRAAVQPQRTGQAERPLPDFAAFHEQLRTHKHLTLQLLWEEYRQTQPEGYDYSRFCELYHQYRRKLDVVLRQEHTPGEKMFVDWAGDSLPIYDSSTSQIHPASLFVSVLGPSSTLCNTKCPQPIDKTQRYCAEHENVVSRCGRHELPQSALVACRICISGLRW